MTATTFLHQGDVIFKPLIYMVMIGGGAALGAAAITLAQTKGHIWPEKMAPDIKKMFLLEKITKIFKPDFLTDLGNDPAQSRWYHDFSGLGSL